MAASRRTIRSVALTLALGLVGAGCAMREMAAKYEAEQKLVSGHIKTFDDLDYNVFSGEKWSELHRSHSQDVVVHWPDGHTTEGIDKHIEDLKAMFVWAPDTRIKEHPVKIGQRDWTAVIGVMEGTFSQPRPSRSSRPARPTRSRWRPSAIGRAA